MQISCMLDRHADVLLALIAAPAQVAQSIALARQGLSLYIWVSWSDNFIKNEK